MTETTPKTDDNSISNPKTPQQYLRLFFSGFAMGSADIVPGVSGGTMAFILGVYESLINAIKSFNIDAIRLALGFKIPELLEHISFRFLIALGLGLATAVITLASVLEGLLETQPTFVFAFFAGLILASIIAIGYKVKWYAGSIISLIVGTVVAFVIVGLPSLGEQLGHGYPILFVSGMIAICAMILPGISGSFLLLILGQYDFILGAVRGRDIGSIIFVGLGAVVGLLAFSRILSWLLKNYEHVTIASLVGFMIGSLRLIYHRAFYVTEEINGIDTDVALDVPVDQLAIALGILLIGFILVTVIDHAQSRKNPVMTIFSRGSN